MSAVARGKECGYGFGVFMLCVGQLIGVGLQASKSASYGIMSEMLSVRHAIKMSDNAKSDYHACGDAHHDSPGCESSAIPEYFQNIADSSNESSHSSCGISFEASPTMFFEEIASMLEDDGDGAEASTHHAANNALDRVQSRLLSKHFSSGRLKRTASSADGVRSILSFVGRDSQVFSGDRGDTIVDRKNDSFGNLASIPSTRDRRANGSAAAAGHAMLRSSLR